MSYKKLIDNSLSEANKALEVTPTQVGMFNIKTANQYMLEAAKRPNPKSLYKTFWYEGETCCLFADTNLGKSILAVQIASEIAVNEIVLYFDFELSDKQFQLRYTDDEGNLYSFPNNLQRVEINPEALTSSSEDEVMKNIEDAANQCEAKVLIIDNLTFLCSQSEKADAAAELMKRLCRLKKQYGWSLLIVAHTPKRPYSAPLIGNDLAGSRKLLNFFDSAFAIGRSAKDHNLRYLKQIKCRNGEFTHGADNVIVCEIQKINSFTQFVFAAFANEQEHLQSEEGDKETLISQVKALSQMGKSQRAIANELGISVGAVNKYINR